MTPPSSSKVEELVREAHVKHCACDEWDLCWFVDALRQSVLAALELAAERLWYAQERTAWEIVRSLSIPSEKPREEP